MTRRRQQQRSRETFWRDQPGLFDFIADDTDDASVLSPMSDEDLCVPERLRYMSFGSGSSGNCAYIGTASCGLLIDAGVDNEFVENSLRANGVDADTIRGILLTHDHGDHVKYAYSILRRHRNMRLYATPKAFGGVLRRHSISRRIKDYHQPIHKEFPFQIGPLTITAFETSHDGTDNAGFIIEGFGVSFVVATDMGKVTARADYYIRQASHLMIESNYDLAMLRNGHYPRHLKARIESAIGHLDNADAASYLADVAAAGTLKRVFLCHLSQDNNTPEIAVATVGGALVEAGYEICTGDVADGRLHLSALPRLEATSLIFL